MATLAPGGAAFDTQHITSGLHQLTAGVVGPSAAAGGSAFAAALQGQLLLLTWVVGNLQNALASDQLASSAFAADEASAAEAAAAASKAGAASLPPAVSAAAIDTAAVAGVLNLPGQGPTCYPLDHST